MALKDLHKYVSSLKNTSLMPALFIGHGSPMNAIEDNEFSRTWKLLSELLPVPSAIVSVSAHWETKGTSVTISSPPKMIHDFYGFPRQLYEQEYPAKGSPELAKEIIAATKRIIIEEDVQWGLDHGTWSVLKYIYPKANIPVIQISLNRYQDPQWHFELSKELTFLRNKGVLVIGSGNMIHNLRILQVNNNDFNAEYGYDWAFELNDILKKKIQERNLPALINYQSLHKDAMLAIPIPEHYLPMLYILGIIQESDDIYIFNDKVIAGSLNMTSFMVG